MTCWFVATNSAVFGERQSSLPSESQIVVPLAVETFEIVVVDDGSGDGTAEVAEATGKAIGLLLPENLGKGGAVRMGMLAATGRTRVFLDADLAYGPGEVIRILSEIESGWDVAVGTRRDSRLDAQTNAGAAARLCESAPVFDKAWVRLSNCRNVERKQLHTGAFLLLDSFLEFFNRFVDCISGFFGQITGASDDV